MEEEVQSYLENRLTDQINWHSNKSQINQKKYKKIRVIVILCASILPFIAGLRLLTSFDLIQTIVIGVISIIIAVCEGLLSLNKYQDLWIQYRLTAENLEREKFLFVNKVGIYDNEENAFKNLVSMVESILSSQNDSWINTNASKKN